VGQLPFGSPQSACWIRKASLAPLPSLGFARQETVSLSENTPRPDSSTM
jgi:hypothetical protein